MTCSPPLIPPAHQRLAKRQREATTTARPRTRARATTTAPRAARATTAAVGTAPTTVTLLIATQLLPEASTTLRSGRSLAVAVASDAASSALHSGRLSASDPLLAASASLPASLGVASTSGLSLVAAGQANAVTREHLPLGAIVGIVAGGVAVIVAVLAGLSFCMIRARRRRQEERGWWAAGVGPVPPGGKRPKKGAGAGESRTSLLGQDEKVGGAGQQPQRGPLPPLPADQAAYAYDGTVSRAPSAPSERPPSLGRRLQGSLKRLGGGSLKGLGTGSLKRLGSKSSRSVDDNSGRVSPFDVNHEKPVRPHRASDDLFLALALPDPVPEVTAPLRSRASLDKRKKDTIMGLAEVYGNDYEVPAHLVPLPSPALTSASKRASIRDQVISRPSLDESSRPSFDRPRSLKRGPSNQSQPRTSRRFSVSSGSALQPLDGNVGRRPPLAHAMTSPLPAPAIKRAKPPPTALGLGHPTAPPSLLPATGPSASRAPIRNLSPIREVDSRNVSGASIEPEVKAVGAAHRTGYERQSVHSAAGDIAEVSPVKAAFPFPPHLPPTATFGPPRLELPSPVLLPGTSSNLAAPPTPVSPSPMSPFVTGTARRISVAHAPANLVSRAAGPPVLSEVVTAFGSHDADGSDPASPSGSDGGAFNIGAALLSHSAAPSPSLTMSSGPSSQGMVATPSPTFAPQLTLGELALEASQPDYRSATWSIYGLYGESAKSPLLQGAFPMPPSPIPALVR